MFFELAPRGDMLDNDPIGTGLLWGSNKVPPPGGIRRSKELGGSTVLWSRRIATAVWWGVGDMSGVEDVDDAHGHAASGTHQPVGR